MSGTETLVRDALSAAAEIRDVDVDRLWDDFRTTADRPLRSPQRSPWFVPLAAAAATLLLIGLVVVGRAELGGTATPTDQGDAYALDQLPPWENGASASTFPLPAPASTPVVFDAVAGIERPVPGHSRVVAYFTGQPTRLCVVEIFRPNTGAPHTSSIACAGESGYTVTPAASGITWWLGTVPPPATNAEVTVDGRPVDVAVVLREGMPRRLFFAQLPRVTAPLERLSIRWKFTDDNGHVVGQSSDEPTTPATQPGGDGPLVFHATPVGGTATFDEPAQPGDAAGSHRVLHIYYAGTEHGFCSNEQTIIDGQAPRTVSEDCGFTTSDDVLSIGQWLPANSGGSATKTTFWGVMPPGATKAVIVTTAGRTPVQSAQKDGMPTGVYAGTVDRDTSPAVFYFLDADGHVVAAEQWSTRFGPPPG